MNKAFKKQDSAVAGCLPAAQVARPVCSFSERATPYSGIKPASGVAAELRHTPAKRHGHTVKRYPSLSVHSSPPRPQLAGSNRLKQIGMEIVDGVCTVAAMLMLGVVAVFILAL